MKTFHYRTWNPFFFFGVCDPCPLHFIALIPLLCCYRLLLQLLALLFDLECVAAACCFFISVVGGGNNVHHGCTALHDHHAHYYKMAACMHVYVAVVGTYITMATMIRRRCAIFVLGMLYEGPNVGRSRKPNFIGSGVVSNIATLDVCETMCREWTAVRCVTNPTFKCLLSLSLSLSLSPPVVWGLF